MTGSLDNPLCGVVFQEFKGEAYQLQIEMERLNHQAGLLLKKVTEEYDRCAIQEPMTELKMLWDNLDENIINRQVGQTGGSDRWVRQGLEVYYSRVREGG